MAVELIKGKGWKAVHTSHAAHNLVLRFSKQSMKAGIFSQVRTSRSCKHKSIVQNGVEFKIGFFIAPLVRINTTPHFSVISLSRRPHGLRGLNAASFRFTTFSLS